ncbi:rfnT [Symbiodinium pilosum]|uniref:RfnT protein n=1 Tax=Symbiodinium pilosum TaxID=2952 RepID=A0A812LSH9_SYMPI|nr:rfnT [Symbiodinium pilosum]
MVSGKSGFEEPVKLDLPADDRTSVLLLSGAWAAAFAIFASNVATLTLAVAPTAPKTELETLPLGLALVMQGVGTVALPTKVRYLGRKYMYIMGAAIGLVSCGALALGCWLLDFNLQCLGAALMGYSFAHAANYRFGAIQAMPSNPPRAISLVLFGGVVGALLGPGAISQAHDLLPVPFLGVYLCGGILNLFGLLMLGFVKLPETSQPKTAAGQRYLSQIVLQPLCGAAIVAVVSSYSMMLILMAPTPAVMKNYYSHSFTASTLTMTGHMFCMFAPSPLTGKAIARVGTVPVIFAGLLCAAMTSTVLYLGTELLFFVFGMILLGFAWNFMYVGGSALLTKMHSPAEGPKLQAMTDCAVNLGAATFTLLSMPIVSSIGWIPTQLLHLGMTSATALLVGALWVLDRRRKAASSHLPQAQHASCTD